MKRLRSATTTRRTRDRIATRAHRCVVHGGWATVTAAFGLAAAGAWLHGPPVFAFVLGQTGLAVSLTPASPALLAVGEVALASCSAMLQSQRRFRRGVWRSLWAGSWEERSRVGVADFDPWLRQLF